MIYLKLKYVIIFKKIDIKTIIIIIYTNIMKIMSTSIQLESLVNICFTYVFNVCELYKIDESHALKHSMDVYKFSKNIYESEVIKNPDLRKYEAIIYTAAIGHDMCDKKYMDVEKAIKKYKDYLMNVLNPDELDIVGKIIGTMSYSTVKKNGYPELGESQLAYHIVREADLLAAYDIDRCIIYTMYRDKCKYTEGLTEALNLFDYRVFKMRKDRLFKTDYSKKESLKLHKKALKDVETLKSILKRI